MSNSIAHQATGRGHTERIPRGGLLSALLNIIKSPKGIQALVVLTDVTAIIFTFIAFVYVRAESGVFSDLAGYPFWLTIQTVALVLVFWLGFFWFSGLYISVHNRAFFDEYYSILKVLLAGFLLAFLAIYFATASTPSGLSSHRFEAALIYFPLLAASIGVGRFLVRGLVRRLRRAGIGLRRTVIIGDSMRSKQLLEMFTHKPELGYQVVGTIPIGGYSSEEFEKRSLGTVDEISRVIGDEKIEVTVIGTEQERDLVLRLMTETAVADTTIKIIPDLYDIVSGQARAQHLYGIPLIEVNPRIMPVWEQHMKRVLDILISVVVLMAGSPIWLLTALATKLEDGGPVFYSQERVGLSGRTFMMHKFRSMGTDAERKGISWTTVNDPRVTRVGRITRKLHIDEIPQLWNVLVGEMSIVGPRPERPFYVEKYSKLLPSYPRRLRVKPGLTGWNQVQAEEIVENIEFVQERIRHDFFYIENMSLRLDIEIMFRTVLRILQRKGQA